MGFENRVLIGKKVLKELQDIPGHERELIKDRISKLAFFPLDRVIFEYDKENRLIKILKVGKRENVY